MNFRDFCNFVVTENGPFAEWRTPVGERRKAVFQFATQRR